jgi:hypothetical protein
MAGKAVHFDTLLSQTVRRARRKKVVLVDSEWYNPNIKSSSESFLEEQM